MYELLLHKLSSRPRGIRGCQGNTGDIFIAKAYPLQPAWLTTSHVDWSGACMAEGLLNPSYYLHLVPIHFLLWNRCEMAKESPGESGEALGIPRQALDVESEG